MSGVTANPKRNASGTGAKTHLPNCLGFPYLIAATARVYVDSERKVEFLPYELDLMKKLGIACLELKNIFKRCQKTLEIAG